MTISQRELSRMEVDREELVERIARVLPHNGVSEPQPGVHLSRFDDTNQPNHTVLEPCFCVIAQSARMRQLASAGGQAHRLVRAIEKLRTHYDKPLRIESLAKEL